MKAAAKDATITTTTKDTKVREEYPPRDIREDTKARRAWIAATLAALQPPFWGKSVALGSYQHIVVYERSTREVREQHRGTCQICGATQACDGNDIAFHGYKRPRWGYLVGRCDGSHLKPAEVEIKHTLAVIEVVDGRIASDEKTLVTVKAQLDAMTNVTFKDEGYQKTWKQQRALESSLWGLRQYRAVLTAVTKQLGKPFKVALLPAAEAK